MLTYEFVVWLLFRSIDSVILIALASWLFIRKALPALRQKILQEHVQKAQLAQEVIDLEQHANALDQQLVDDAREVEGLEQQLRLWQQAVKRKQSRAVADKEDILIRLAKLDEQRAQAVKNHSIYVDTVLEAVDRAGDALSHDAGASRITEKVLSYFVTNKEHA